MKSKLLNSLGNKPRTGIVRNCLFCNIEVYLSPSRAKLYKTTFCSKEHNIAYMKANSFFFECFICGNKKYTQPFQVKLRTRATCSIECRGKVKSLDAQERRKNYTKHQLDRLARYSPEAKTWRKAIFVRDDYTCQVCNVRGTYLEADHIKPWAYFPELRFELSNGRTLCRACHDKTKMSAKRMKEIWG